MTPLSLLRFPRHSLTRPLAHFYNKPLITSHVSVCNFRFKVSCSYTTRAVEPPREPPRQSSLNDPQADHSLGAPKTHISNTTSSPSPSSLSPSSPSSSTPPSPTTSTLPSPLPQPTCGGIPSNSDIQAERVTDLKGLIDAYLSLSKFRLSALIVVTTMAGYVLAPLPFHLSTFIASTVGTSLACASANTFNQIYEVAHDAKMSRTKKRVLPSGRLSVTHATLFGVVTGVVGPLTLLLCVNPFAASLAFANIVLYAGIYTPLKRVHPINTWVGSIVGAIPPVIGWVSATNSMDPGAWVLGALLFIWQIPHFLALSWGFKIDYANAGYKMLSNVYPEKLPKFCMRYCIYLLPIGALSWWTGITDGYFAFDSLLVDAYILWFGYQFYKDNSTVKARKLFFATLLYLPLILGLMILHATKFRNQKQIEDVTKLE